MGVMSDARKSYDLLRRALQSRSAVQRVRRQLAALPRHSPGEYVIGVYFADGAVNIYQLRQWYRPLQELARHWPVVLIARSATGAELLLKESGLPVTFVPTVRDVERFVAQQPLKVVLYVNQNTRNFQMFRYARRWHVFINHGESDKMYMTTNQYKAYDYAFIAGQAARDRLSRVLWNYDLDTRTREIGRPQADHYSGALPYEPDDRTVVLYAPTWEGDRPQAHYGSIGTHGEALVRELLATGKHRIIYRPHPRSGVVRPEYGAANQRIISALAAANKTDPAAAHVYDDGPDLGWQLAAADVAIVDISAMIYDRLATGKPLMVTMPSDKNAVVDTGGYLSACEWLHADAATSIVDEVARVRDDTRAVERLRYWATHYFGDTSPGAATAKFHGAIEELLHEWDRWHAHENGQSYGMR
ncbi:CDP-glycerol glycerophosphotransferase family protein [Microbacterium sp. YY-01]|uniref:CDP-glycerol glycerophosphotransferase family protein n=1 Tax=Microbacterium sp. YY-01 TaxID=3421634 RepID=UPI003D166C9D